MESIGSEQLWSWLSDSEKIEQVSNTRVRKDPGLFVPDYLELAKKVAELQFRNRGYVFLLRGQSGDYKNRAGNSSIRPSMFRNTGNEREDQGAIARRYHLLEEAERLLVEKYRFPLKDRLKKQQLIRWAILQHYEVCATPLLDVTHSLRIAASFATKARQTDAFIFALGVPNISGAITASAEASVTVLRLASICPPEAVRPHIQEGYLLGEYPEIRNWSQKGMYKNYETDFGLRLAAKFRFNPTQFWRPKSNFPRVPDAALYPNGSDDPLLGLAEEIKEKLTHF
ncbi:MAG: FRG domain-containing protein [Parasphingorhabdus sp.]|uniref:FRG domain-containing protein n=1 Tax=Parasphingorhabdus sp. TaxID=2709688 RepID=UPI00329A58E4